MAKGRGLKMQWKGTGLMVKVELFGSQGAEGWRGGLGYRMPVETQSENLSSILFDSTAPTRILRYESGVCYSLGLIELISHTFQRASILRPPGPYSLYVQ